MAERPIALERWAAKKSARVAVATLGLPGRRRGVRVLTYHRFGPGERMPFTVGADAFEREMAYLARTGRAISLADLEDHLARRSHLADGSVLVTIDDGDPSVRTVALPILAALGVPAVLYALAGTPEGYEVLAPSELREIAAAGIAIGSHTVGHRSMGRLTPDEARTEAVDSKARLEDVIGRPVTSFAYPFGTKGDISDGAAQILAEAGYETAFTSLHGAIGAAGTENPLLLPRIKVESGDPSWLFAALCGGAMDRWRLVDEGLSGLQKPQTVAR